MEITNTSMTRWMLHQAYTVSKVLIPFLGFVSLHLQYRVFPVSGYLTFSWSCSICGHSLVMGGAGDPCLSLQHSFHAHLFTCLELSQYQFQFLSIIASVDSNSDTLSPHCVSSFLLNAPTLLQALHYVCYITLLFWNLGLHYIPLKTLYCRHTLSLLNLFILNTNIHIYTCL